MKGFLRVAALILCLVRCAQGSIVDFAGSQQTASGTITGNGSYDITGGSPNFSLIAGSLYTLEPNEQTGSLGLSPSSVALSTNPTTRGIDTSSPNGPYSDASNNPLPNATNITAAGGHLTGASNVGIDLLNGASTSFGTTAIDLTADRYLVAANHDLGIVNYVMNFNDISLQHLFFTQTGGATFTNGAAGTGTYDIPGVLGGSVAANVEFNGISLPTDFKLNQPIDLTGTYHLNGAGPMAALSLDGALNASLPISFDSVLATNLGIIGFTGTFQMNPNINLAMTYHLQGMLVPEPGSIILLGAGFLAVVPLALRRRRRG